MPISLLQILTGLCLVTALGAGLIGCSPANGHTQELKVGDVTVIENPERAPRELKDYFYYPRAHMILSSVYMAGSFLSTPEGAVIYETEDTPETVVKHYTGVIKDQNWTVIQTVDSPEEKMIMAESRFRKIVTIIVRGKGGASSPSQIKIYFKRSDSE